MTTPTLQLARQLLSQPSITPVDAGCLDLISQRLHPLGFTSERMDAGPQDAPVHNLWAVRRGQQTPRPSTNAAHDCQRRLFVFAGHTDVVPTGPLVQWTSPPFAPTVRDGKLYARGASDMKTSIAAFVVALESFLASVQQPAIDIALLLTSDEEGPAHDGTAHVVRTLAARGEALHWCIVGEPTAQRRTGDMVKNGRRGSLGGQLTVKGIQGHIAYPQLARNPIHQAMPALAELAAVQWDQGNAHFPPTSWQISNIHAGTGATNVIPGEVVIDFNFRFSTESTAEGLKQHVKAVLDRHALEYELTWNLSGEPFLTRPGDLLDVAQMAIQEVTGLETALSTSGGTSDGRFIARICEQVMELGPPNASIHQIDEHIALDDVQPLTDIYTRILHHLHEREARRLGKA